MEINIKFPCRKVGSSYVCEINSFYFSASNRTELAKQVKSFIQDNLKDPVVGMVRNGEDIRITTFVGDRYQVHYPVSSDDGIIGMDNRSMGGLTPNQKPIDELKSQALHLAQQQWTHGDPNPPSWLPESKRSEWDAWVRFQIAYKIATDSGCTPGAAHQLACEAMH